MKRVLEAVGTVGVIGALAIAKFGLPAGLPSFSVSEETVDPQAAFDQRWGEQSIRQEVGAFYKNCDAARAAGAAPMRVGEPGYRVNLDRDGDGTACEPYRGY